MKIWKCLLFMLQTTHKVNCYWSPNSETSIFCNKRNQLLSHGSKQCRKQQNKKINMTVGCEDIQGSYKKYREKSFPYVTVHRSMLAPRRHGSGGLTFNTRQSPFT